MDLSLGSLWALIFLAVLSRVGLVAAAGFLLVSTLISLAPPLVLSQCYAGRAMIALLVPVALLAWGFYASRGGQPIFGSTLRED